MNKLPPDGPDDDVELADDWNPADELTATRFIPTQAPPRSPASAAEPARSGDDFDINEQVPELAPDHAITEWQSRDNDGNDVIDRDRAIFDDSVDSEDAQQSSPRSSTRSRSHVHNGNEQSVLDKAKNLFVQVFIKGHAHSHAPGAHEHEDEPLDPRLKRMLTWLVLPFVAITFLGVIVLWPSPDVDTTDVVGQSTLDKGRVANKEVANCPGTTDANNVKCQFLVIEITSGPEKGRFTQLELSVDPPQVAVEVDDRVILNRVSVCSPDNPDTAILLTPECTQVLDASIARDSYQFADFDRDMPMALLLVIFVAAVLLIGRWQGLKSLISLAISLWIIVVFVVPAVFEGSNPVWVSIIGASFVLLLSLYFTHGVTARTTAALIGTYVALFLTAMLALIFAGLGNFTGLTSEDAAFISSLQGNLNLRGLLLGGIIIGAIGVLDDVTVTQSSAVWELRDANPSMDRLRLYRSAMNIGRDHVGSAVNTLALAYAGAAMPLLLVFTVFNRGFTRTVTNEIVAQEVLRTLVGSVGLIASVPVTTAIAAWIVTYGKEGQPSPLACFVPESLVDRFRDAYGKPARERADAPDRTPAETALGSDNRTPDGRTPDPDFWRD